jgi:hypothetical protein
MLHTFEFLEIMGIRKLINSKEEKSLFYNQVTNKYGLWSQFGHKIGLRELYWYILNFLEFPLLSFFVLSRNKPLLTKSQSLQKPISLIEQEFFFLFTIFESLHNNFFFFNLI